MTDIPDGYEEVTSDIPAGYEEVSAPKTTSERIAAQQFPTSALQIMAGMKNEPLVQKTGLGIRAALQGISAPVTMGSDLLGAGVNALAGKEVIPSLGGMVSDTLTNIGLPQPNTSLQRLSSDVIGGAVGGGSIGSNALSSLVGAVSGGASGGARELGASPLAQFATGIAAGVATGGIGGALKSLTAKPTGAAAPIMNNLETQGIDELSSFPKVASLLKDEASKQKTNYEGLFKQAETQGADAYLPASTLNKFAQDIREAGQKEASPVRANLFTNTADNLEKLSTGNNGINAQGILDYKKPLLNDIEMQRRSLTAISKNRDAEGNAAGQLVKKIDEYLNNNIDNVSGNQDGIKTWQDAITGRREYAQKFEQPKDIAAALANNSPEAIEQKFIGAGGASLNKQLSTTYDNTLKALPEDQQTQAGFLLRQSIVNRMVKNAAQSSDSADGISAQRLSNQIRNFRRDNQSMWNNFTPEEQDVLKNMESDLRDKTQGGVVNTVAQHLFKFMGKATKSNLELPRTLKPKTIVTTDELLDLTRQKPQGFGSFVKQGALNPAAPVGSEAAQY